MRVAERWSVNPSALSDLPDGLLADMPPRKPSTTDPSPQTSDDLTSSALGVIESLPIRKKPWWRFW
jgi:hypothetical protein